MEVQDKLRHKFALLQLLRDRLDILFDVWSQLVPGKIKLKDIQVGTGGYHADEQIAVDVFDPVVLEVEAQFSELVLVA